MDFLTPVQRSQLMSKIRSAATKPELRVRKLIYGMGYRYRLNVKTLPGTPDIVFRSRKKVIFVHGCFWHGHACGKVCKPKSRAEFWEEKIKRNRARDIKNDKELRKAGWKTLTVWECQLRVRDTEALLHRLRNFLEN